MRDSHDNLKQKTHSHDTLTAKTQSHDILTHTRDSHDTLTNDKTTYTERSDTDNQLLWWQWDTVLQGPLGIYTRSSYSRYNLQYSYRRTHILKETNLLESTWWYKGRHRQDMSSSSCVDWYFILLITSVNTSVDWSCGVTTSCLHTRHNTKSFSCFIPSDPIALGDGWPEMK